MKASESAIITGYHISYKVLRWLLGILLIYMACTVCLRAVSPHKFEVLRAS